MAAGRANFQTASPNLSSLQKQLKICSILFGSWHVKLLSVFCVNSLVRAGLVHTAKVGGIQRCVPMYRVPYLGIIFACLHITGINNLEIIKD